MTSNTDWLANIYLFTFLFGLVFTIVSFFLGASHLGGFDSGSDAGSVHVDAGTIDAGHVDVGHAGGGPADVGHGDGGGLSGPSLFNLPTIMAFLTWFGGAGYLFVRTFGIGVWLSVPLALISGLLGGGIMFVLMARLLWPMISKPMNRRDYQLPGTPARVVSSIREGGVGEIVYTKAGSRFTAGARSMTEQPIAKGEEVVIIKYERGLAYVQSVDDLLSSRGGEAKPA